MEGGRRRILEVGPGKQPMHHRSKGEEGGNLQLGEDEEYTGVDLTPQFEHAVWKNAKDQYGDRAHLIQGDRSNMKDVADASIDELVALGTHAQDGKIVAEFHRVLRPGGILRLGTTTQYLDQLMSTWGVRLQRLGYMELSSEQAQYDYTSRPDIPEATVSYSVVSFQKAGKSNE